MLVLYRYLKSPNLLRGRLSVPLAPRPGNSGTRAMIDSSPEVKKTKLDEQPYERGQRDRNSSFRMRKSCIWDELVALRSAMAEYRSQLNPGRVRNNMSVWWQMKRFKGRRQCQRCAYHLRDFNPRFVKQKGREEICSLFSNFMLKKKPTKEGNNKKAKKFQSSWQEVVDDILRPVVSEGGEEPFENWTRQTKCRGDAGGIGDLSRTKIKSVRVDKWVDSTLKWGFDSNRGNAGGIANSCSNTGFIP